MVIPQVSLLNLTPEACIPGDVMWSLIDGKHIVYVPHHDGLFVDRVNDCLDEDIDGGTEVLFDVGEDSEGGKGGWRGRGRQHSVPTKVWLLISELLDFERVVLPVRGGVSGVLCYQDSLMVTLDLMYDIYIRY